MASRKQTKTRLLTEIKSEYHDASADVWKWFTSQLEKMDWDEIMESGDIVVEKHLGEEVEGFVLEFVVLMTRELAKIEKRLK